MIRHYLIPLLLIFSIQTLNAAKAQVLDYDSLLKKSIDHSFDLKISTIDIGISEATLKSSKSEYFPTLTLGHNFEYENNLAGNNGTFASVGNTFLSPNTRFQNLFYFSLNYTLVDFGGRKHKYLLSKVDIDQKEYEYQKQLRDLKLSLIQLYSESLTLYTEKELYKDLLNVNKELFTIKQRLFESGTSNKLNVMGEAIKIARAKDRIDQSKAALEQRLKDLSFYTSEEYDPEKVIFNNIYDFGSEENKNMGTIERPLLKQRIEEKIMLYPDINKNQFVEDAIFTLEIEKKQHELETVKSQRFPKFDFYSNYIFYGQDQDDPLGTFKDMKSSNVSVGISMSLPLFDGFKNSAERQKLELEIERLAVQREKELTSIYTEFQKVKKSADSAYKDLKNKEELMIKIKDKLTALQRLNISGFVQKSDVLNQQSELIGQLIDLEKSIIKAFLNIKQLEIYSEDSK